MKLVVKIIAVVMFAGIAFMTWVSLSLIDEVKTLVNKSKTEPARSARAEYKEAEMSARIAELEAKLNSNTNTNAREEKLGVDLPKA